MDGNKCKHNTDMSFWIMAVTHELLQILLHFCVYFHDSQLSIMFIGLVPHANLGRKMAQHSKQYCEHSRACWS